MITNRLLLLWLRLGARREPKRTTPVNYPADRHSRGPKLAARIFPALCSREKQKENEHRSLEMQRKHEIVLTKEIDMSEKQRNYRGSIKRYAFYDLMRLRVTGSRERDKCQPASAHWASPFVVRHTDTRFCSDIRAEYASKGVNRKEFDGKQ